MVDKGESSVSASRKGDNVTPTRATAPTPTTPSIDAIIQLLSSMSKQLDAVEKKLDEHCDSQSEANTAFMIAYTKSNSELESAIKRVDEKAERANMRIDSITKLIWTLMSPLLIALIISIFGFLWAILNHTVVVTMP